MGEPERDCPHCGAAVRKGVRFCNDCGKQIPDSGPPPGAMGRTMLGIEQSGARPPEEPAAPSADASAPEQTSSAAGTKNPTMQKTMLGFTPSAPSPPTPNPPTPDAVAPEDTPPEPKAAPAKSKSMAQTMLGVTPSAAGDPPPAPQTKATPKQTPAGTMLGLPQGGPAAPEPASTRSDPNEDTSASKSAGKEPPLGGATMMAGSEASPMLAGAPAAGVARAADEPKLTMLGVGQATPSSVPPRVTPAETGPIRTEYPDAGWGNRGRWVVLGVVIVAVGVALGVALRGGRYEVQARVIQEAAGEWLQLDVAGAPDGAKLRFGGQEQPLERGRARFALGADSLRVGDNVVLADVVTPDGHAEPVKLTLRMDYRVRVDTAPLHAGKPKVDVVVSALPDSKVTLDGEPLTLDAEGHGVRSDDVDVVEASKRGTHEHVVRYRIEPPEGEPAVGEHRQRIAVTTLHVDRPGEAFDTDRDVVEIAGAVTEGATVRIDDAEVQVQGGRFLHRYPLPKPGKYEPHVHASEPGKLPVSQVLQVTRLTDLSKVASSFDADISLDYAKLAQNPIIYRGQKIAIEGKVYNVSVDAGHSVLQVLARDCPKERRCPLWVTHPAATDFGVGDWVRILGTVEGTQQFRADSDEVVTVPKLAAQYLLPAEL